MSKKQVLVGAEKQRVNMKIVQIVEYYKTKRLDDKVLLFFFHRIYKFFLDNFLTDNCNPRF